VLTVRDAISKCFCLSNKMFRKEYSLWYPEFHYVSSPHCDSFWKKFPSSAFMKAATGPPHGQKLLNSTNRRLVLKIDDFLFVLCSQHLHRQRDSTCLGFPDLIQRKNCTLFLYSFLGCHCSLYPLKCLYTITARIQPL